MCHTQVIINDDPNSERDSPQCLLDVSLHACAAFNAPSGASKAGWSAFKTKTWWKKSISPSLAIVRRLHCLAHSILQCLGKRYVTSFACPCDSSVLIKLCLLWCKLNQIVKCMASLGRCTCGVALATHQEPSRAAPGMESATHCPTAYPLHRFIGAFILNFGIDC